MENVIYSEALNRLERAGFFIQEPARTDKTYFLTRHTELSHLVQSEQLWIILKKKKPVVDYRVDYIKAIMSDKLEETIAEFLSDLGYDEYIIE